MNLIIKDGIVLDYHADNVRIWLGEYPIGARIAWVPDFTKLTIEGEPREVPDPREAMNQDVLVNCIRQDIDRKTQELIVYGYSYRGVRFPCTLDQQMNFKATYDMRDMLTYPFRVKGNGQNFLMLEDEADVFNWFMTGFQHVHGNLQVGWQMKTDVASLTLQELMSYQDPRA